MKRFASFLYNLLFPEECRYCHKRFWEKEQHESKCLNFEEGWFDGDD